MTDMQTPSCSRKPSNSSIASAGPILCDPPLLNPEEEEEDRQHIQKIITALRYYRKYANARVNKTESYLNSLPERHQIMLTKYRKHLGAIRDCIDQNQAVIKRMLLCPNPCESSDGFMQQDIDGRGVKIRPQDMENAQSTLKLIARDWSAEGATERDQSYKPIIDAVEKYFKPDQYEPNEIKVLVPGAGLGRLTYELACRGYDCEGNEFSYFMMIASNFVLNQCTEERKYTLYPWVHQYVNNLRMEDQVAAIRFPDVCPVKHPPKGRLSIAAGDFLQVYTVPDSYDCVATCFFIDCANNIVEFIETIYRVLVPGGIWVNLGPLLYHYSDMQGEHSIEPTYENLVLVIEMVGFEILQNECGIRTKYAQNPRSLLKSEYESLFWICRKPMNANANNRDYSNDVDDVISDDYSQDNNDNNYDVLQNGRNH